MGRGENLANRYTTTLSFLFSFRVLTLTHICYTKHVYGKVKVLQEVVDITGNYILVGKSTIPQQV